MTSKAPQIRVGLESFQKLLLTSDVFVDKSLFIKELLDSSGDVILITRPRRWGKSMNMDMLKCFVEIETDVRGVPLPSTQCINSKLFLGGEVDLKRASGAVKLLKPLKIAHNHDMVSDYLGKYPVINVNFKECKGDDYAEIESGIRAQIIQLFIYHGYLEQYTKDDSHLLKDVQKKKLLRYLSGEIDKQDIKDSLFFLSELLFQHFKQKCYILIDEYDSPINFAYTKFGFGSKELESVVTVFQGMFGSAFKDNDFLEKGVITGILRIAKANLFSGLNNVSENTLLDENFSKSYGFTQDEVDKLLSQVPMKTEPELVKSWYNGYTFGGETIYNPWSIMQVLSRQGAVDNYWIDSGGTGILTKSFLSDDMQQNLQTLLNGESITVPIAKQVSFEDIDKPMGFFSLLLFAGYLNPKVVDREESIYALSIPNKEVSNLYRLRVIDWVTSKIKSDITQYYSLVTLLTKRHPEQFKLELQTLLQNATSFYQVGAPKAELFYSGFMLGLINTVSTTHIIDSEIESGGVRPDIVLIPKSGKDSTLAIIIEYKVSKTVENLDNVAAIALKQINDKHYDIRFKTYPNIQSILKIGMAFAGKEMEMEWVIEAQ